MIWIQNSPFWFPLEGIQILIKVWVLMRQFSIVLAYLIQFQFIIHLLIVLDLDNILVGSSTFLRIIRLYSRDYVLGIEFKADWFVR